MLSIDGSELGTLLAALRFYQERGQGEPGNRSDDIHTIATNGDREISLDAEGIDRLCENLNFGCRSPRAAPADAAEWTAVAAERGWSDAVLADARASVDSYENETVIELPGDVALYMPAHPAACDYLRVVDRAVGRGVELMYWSSEEWQQAPQEVIGAVMGLLKGFQPTLALQLEQLRVPPVCYERTADEDEMARHIANLATGEVVADPEAARAVVLERFSRDVWRLEVSNDETQLGYWEWALHEAEAERAESEAPRAAMRGG